MPSRSGDVPLPIALWSTPRSVSTAFDRMMRERGDVEVLTEPFSTAYYYGPDRVSDRFADEALPDAGYDEVWDDVMARAAERPVFVKEMPHHLGPLLEPDRLACFTSTFLIRDPARAVPSFVAKWPDVTDEELGYEAQHRAFELVAEQVGETPPVIEARDLRSDPEGVVEAWCDAVGLDPVADALTWEPGLPDGWELWADWFERAAASTGFAPPDPGPPPPVDDLVAERIERCLPHYEELRAHRLLT